MSKASIAPSQLRSPVSLKCRRGFPLWRQSAAKVALAPRGQRRTRGIVLLELAFGYERSFAAD